MSFLKWMSSGIVVSLLIVMVGVVGNGNTFVSQATAEDNAKPYHTDITDVEETYTSMEFNVNRKTHLLRKTRIEYYLAQAKQADKRGWDHQRKDIMRRVENILAHHLTQYAQEVDAEMSHYTSA